MSSDAGVREARSPAAAPVRAFFRGRRLWVGLAVAVFLSIVVVWKLRPTRVPAVTVVRSALEQRIVVSGRVMPPSRVEIASMVTGLVADVPAVEGRHVAAGELLIRLDDRPMNAEVAQARASVLGAQARIEQLRRVGAIVASEGLSQADARLSKAEADLARTRSLVESGTLASSQLDDAKNGFELARSARAAALVQSVGASASGADTRAALATLEQTRAQLESEMLRLAQARILAPRAGVVLTRSVEPGQVVQPGRALVTLALDGDSELVLSLDERNLAFLAVGQPAIASADAFPDERFDAVVRTIAPSVDPLRGTVDVRLDVPRPPPRLRPDLTVSVDILVGKKDSVLVIPSEAVRDVASPHPWVVVSEMGRAARREVKLGLRGEGMVEVQAGVTEGQQVLVPRSALPLGLRVVPEPRGG